MFLRLRTNASRCQLPVRCSHVKYSRACIMFFFSNFFRKQHTYLCTYTHVSPTSWGHFKSYLRWSWFTRGVVKALVRWATFKRLTNRLPKLSLITLSPPFVNERISPLGYFQKVNQSPTQTKPYNSVLLPILHPVGQLFPSHNYWLMYRHYLLIIIGDYFIRTSIIYVRTSASRCERCSHEILSSMRAWVLFIFLPQTHLLVPDFLPLPIHQRHTRTYMSPASRFDVNEQKTNILTKAARSPPPSPWPSTIHHAYDTIYPLRITNNTAVLLVTGYPALRFQRGEGWP